MKHTELKKLILLTFLLAATGAHAEDKFTVNGFGYQEYRQSNANLQDGVDRRGSWAHGAIAFVVSAKASERDTVWAQLESTLTEPTAFTWAFLDHRFTDDLTMQVGRVKYPLGLYNEFIDNKWLQLGVLQPSVYSPSADMVHDAYTGVGFNLTSGSLSTQVYAGNVYNNPPEDMTGAIPFIDRRTFGGRITWNAPIDGLRLMFSAYRAQVESTQAPTPAIGEGVLGNEDRSIVSFDYVSDLLDIKAEYASHKVPELPTNTASSSNASYIQGGYKIGPWMPYVRYDTFLASQSNTSDPSVYQKDMTVGVGYRVSDDINARIEYHNIKGYGLAVAGGGTAGKTNWNLIAAGVNFIF